MFSQKKALLGWFQIDYHSKKYHQRNIVACLYEIGRYTNSKFSSDSFTELGTLDINNIRSCYKICDEEEDSISSTNSKRVAKNENSLKETCDGNQAKKNDFIFSDNE